MALNVTSFKIQLADKLRTGFRAKYNLLLEKVIEDCVPTEVGFNLVTEDGSIIEVDLTEYFYNKETIDTLFLGFGYATEEQAGIIRIGTIDEVMELSDDLVAVTPYKLGLVLAYYNGRLAFAGEDLIAGDLIYLKNIPSDDPPDPLQIYPKLTAFKAIATIHEDTLTDTLCVGYAEVDALEGEDVFFRLAGNINTLGVDLVPGTRYYLSAEEPGKYTSIPPRDPGLFQQEIGVAVSDLEIMFIPMKGWLNWAPIYDNIPTLYMTEGQLSSAMVDLPPLLWAYNQVYVLDDAGFPVLEDNNYDYRFLLLPSWITDHTVVFGTMTITGTPTAAGTYKFLFEVTDANKRTWLQEFTLVVGELPEVDMSVLDTSGFPDFISLGPIPGFYEVPDKTDAMVHILGLHDGYQIKLNKGGIQGGDELVNETKDLGSVAENGRYYAFEQTNGSELEIGLYRLEFISKLGNIEFPTVGYFTLYDETTKDQIKFELWNSANIGDIARNGITNFKYPTWFTTRVIPTGLPHDQVVMTTFLNGVQISTRTINVVAGFYNQYTVPQTGQLPGEYTTIVQFKLGGNVVSEAQAQYVILPEALKGKANVILTKSIANTADYTEVNTLPADGSVTVDLFPNGYGFLIKDFGALIDELTWEVSVKTSGSFSPVDLSVYTLRPNKKTFSKPVSTGEVLLFWGLTSKDIGTLHAAPSSVRVKGVGSLAGEPVVLITGEVNFRVPIDPASQSGLHFGYVNRVTGVYTLVDPNMPPSGGVYALPKDPNDRWTVSFQKLFSGLPFNSGSISGKRNGIEMHNPGFAYIMSYYVNPADGYPGYVTTELKTNKELYVIGTWDGDNRNMLNPANAEVDIDTPALWHLDFYVFNPLLVGAYQVDFELVDPDSITPDPDDDGSECCKPKFWDFDNQVEWDIPHGLDSHPIFVYLIAGKKWDTETQYPDTMNAKAVWKRPRTGRAETK